MSNTLQTLDQELARCRSTQEYLAWKMKYSLATAAVFKLFELGNDNNGTILGNYNARHHESSVLTDELIKQRLFSS
jgi:hypothetical protein